MKIALIGATGFVGAPVLQELLARGHQVLALARNPAKLAAQPGLSVVQADAKNADSVAAAVRGVDAVVSAYNPGWGVADIYTEFLDGTRAIYAGVKQAGVKRLLVVGGAGSLYAAPGLQLVDTPQFPAEWKQGALAAREALNLIRAETTLDWSFLSPAVHLEPGERRGRYRLGLESPVMDTDPSKGPAHISVADLAVAIVDELETPQHIQRRFTVGY
ncbi:NAD(P)-dependent oxidoreductase [Paucibacter sp. PLA-PC-4]|uniref:NAD(P)-dependent oxidoreductase n=1 Tax=Paucibacter sp. PLA-PC-4 TaxID=2993655 RepID=UPI00224B9139|nr:NAD(P)-dependent oxidoreductase [Paucibacter sp. PLA-PC-4]MCX2864315.1 NAD(P)-dependent oxidoreductase [Paucibacter sp. PLA-PC-4]